MLAYSSIGQVSLIAVGIGLATPLGLAAALLHIMNHAVMKGCLFLVATAVRFRTGTNDLTAMRGLGRSMPVTMLCFLVAALAMVGVPPLMGFFSKFYLVQAGLDVGNWFVLVVVLSSGLLTAAYTFRVIEHAYLGRVLLPAEPARDVPIPHESTVGAAWNQSWQDPPLDMLLPVMLLAAATLVLGMLGGAILVHVLEPGIQMAQER
jgi:multicomponent Na+:H+ antiporter subunit D